MTENKQRILAAYDAAAKSGPGPKSVLISEIPGQQHTIISNNNNIGEGSGSPSSLGTDTHKETLIILDVKQDSVQTNFY